jgi:hypothetical protein
MIFSAAPDPQHCDVPNVFDENFLLEKQNDGSKAVE